MAFSFQEKYDMKNASRLNYDVVPDEYKDRIKNTLKRTTNGSLKVNYKQTMKGIGRYYASVANKNGGSCVPIQSMPSIVRNALTANIYHDIDIVNCHSTLLEIIASKLDIPIPTPNLTHYNLHRQEVLEPLGDGAKNLVQRIVYGGSIEQWKSDFNFEGDVQKIFHGIAHEVREVTLALLQENPDYLKITQEIKKSPNVKAASVMSYYLGTVESEIIKIAMDYMSSHEWVVGAYVFDGFLVEKRDGLQLDLEEVEKHIFNKTTYSIKLKEKPIIVDPQVLLAASEYALMKCDFELTHFKVMNPYCFGRVITDDQLQILNENELKGQNKNKILNDKHVREQNVLDATLFTDLWQSDPEIRTYEKIDLLPPPLYVPENVFNTWRGFPVETFESGGEYDWFIKHLEACYEPDVTTYLLKWLAWLVQKPAMLPGVCVVITGQQGTGKSLIFEKLMAKMLGCYYGTTNNPKNDLFGTFAELKNGKRLVVINDCPVSQVKGGSEQFKSLITDEESRYERKFHQSISMRNITSYMMITNSDEPVRLEASDRRYMVAECKSVFVGKFDYFKELALKIEDPKNVRAVYDYLMNYDISKVDNLSRERPITQAYLDNKMICADKELLFLGCIAHTFPRIPIRTSQFYDEYKAWATSYGGISDEKYLRNLISFSKYMKKIAGCVFKSDNSHGSRISFDKTMLIKHLENKGVEVDGHCNFETTDF